MQQYKVMLFQAQSVFLTHIHLICKYICNTSNFKHYIKRTHYFQYHHTSQILDIFLIPYSFSCRSRPRNYAKLVRDFSIQATPFCVHISLNSLYWSLLSLLVVCLHLTIFPYVISTLNIYLVVIFSSSHVSVCKFCICQVVFLLICISHKTL